MSAEVVHDVIAVGAGPFNLGLAALAEPTGLDVRVLESQERFSWHPGMLVEGATLQVPFLADLVTMADPTSRWSFLNYLKQHDRLYPFYIRESFNPLRAEYDAYCRWVSENVPGIHFGTHVDSLAHDPTDDVFVATVSGPEGPREVRGRHLVVGVGTSPHVPAALSGSDGVVHSSTYLVNREALTAARRVAVVGSGQSAAEIVHDLLGRRVSGDDALLTWVTRSPRFFPMEYTKLTLEMTSPDYVDHFHALPEPTRDRLGREQRTLYKGISGDLVDAIHESLYEASLDGRPAARLGTSQEVVALTQGADGVTLTLRHDDTGETGQITVDAVVAATGYRSEVLPLVAGLPGVTQDAAGRPHVTRDFTLDGGAGRLFVQNGEEHTHALTAPDLGMGAHRNSVILNRILGRQVYRVEERIAFQTFGVLHD